MGHPQVHGMGSVTRETQEPDASTAGGARGGDCAGTGERYWRLSASLQLQKRRRAAALQNNQDAVIVRTWGAVVLRPYRLGKGAR
jgi:hypothetical protein